MPGADDSSSGGEEGLGAFFGQLARGVEDAQRNVKGFLDEKIAELYDKYSADPRDDREDKRRPAAGGGAGGKRKAR